MMRKPISVFSLAVALLAATAMPVIAAIPPPYPPVEATLQDRLAQLLRDLDQDQSSRLTHSASAGEARFSAARPEQLMQALSGSGQTALILLGRRGTHDNAPLVLQRALRVSGGQAQTTATAPGTAYLLNRPAGAELSGMLSQVLSQGRWDTVSDPVALESATTVEAIAAVNSWTGVRFIAGLETADGVLRELFLVPDSIRVSITGDGSTPVAARPGNSSVVPEQPRAATATALASAAEPESRAPLSELAKPQPQQLDWKLRQDQEQMERENEQRMQQDRERMKQEQIATEATAQQRMEQQHAEMEQKMREEWARH